MAKTGIKLVAILAGCMGIATLEAQAQTQGPTEATRWLVSPAGKDIHIYVVNAGARPARVMVERRGGNTPPAQGQRGIRLGEVQTIVSGGSSIFWQPEESRTFNYAVVIADEPVVVSATAAYPLNFVSQPLNRDNGDLDIYEQLPGSQIGTRRYIGRQTSDWNMGAATVSVSAIPINCADAPAGHFVCGLRLPFGAGIDNYTAPRPGETRQFSPPARPPEPRTAPTPNVSPRDRTRNRARMPQRPDGRQ